MRKLFLKLLPYVASIVAGILFYIIGIQLTDNIKDLFIGVSATFITIPFLYLIYERTYNLSKRTLNKEIFDYAKMQIDNEILSIINHLSKLIYSFEERDNSLNGIKSFLALREDSIKDNIAKKEVLGFQVFKKWAVSEENLHSILKNPYILQKLEDEQIISIILIIKNLRFIEQLQKTKDLYSSENKEVPSYKVVSGKEISDYNTDYPDRCLLLKKLENDKFQVIDFGDFSPSIRKELLQLYKINNKYIDIYSIAIFNLIEEMNKWIDLTGSEFLIDTKMFRLGHSQSKNSRDTLII